MFEILHVVGYEALKKVAAEKSFRTIILFTGGVDPSTGKSWCPDCIAGDITFLILFTQFCNVGNRQFWKDRNNPFRTDEDLKVSCIPTLLDCAVKGKRLTEGQLTNDELIKDFFTEDF
uniref:Thioredoxin domain-containing protein 17 n=1 Tax=Syphacia muris TaxID=451379 RepID=A0A0N5AB44_9BILA